MSTSNNSSELRQRRRGGGVEERFSSPPGEPPFEKQSNNDNSLLYEDTTDDDAAVVASSSFSHTRMDSDDMMVYPPSNDTNDNNTNNNNINTTTTTTNVTTTDTIVSSSGPRKAMSGQQVMKDEQRKMKILIRIVFALCMFSVFIGLVYVGHLYICAFIAFIELLLFRELVRVRYSAYYERIQDTIPLFRTTQWLWFALAIFHTYGDFVSEIIQSNVQLHYLLPFAQYFPTVSFLLYSGTFVLTITTLQRDNIKFQMNQLCWTVLVLCITVGQLKYIMHNIFNGLFWFVLPCCLVFTNDIMAYVSGMLWGRRFIHREFIRFSPNKTWEGFIGGWFFTMIAAWHLSRFLAQYSWMTCPTNEFTLQVPAAHTIQCDMDPIFLPALSTFPPQIFELFPNSIIKMLFPRIVEICYDKNNDILTRCVSGEIHYIHHHFELSIHNYYPIQIHALWLGLFASLVAPFGGFFASAIKRAYGIKDFDSIIPGHGGVMDRMDCQFLMALCTWVHYNSFVKFSTISVPKLTFMYTLLSDHEKEQFLQTIAAATTNNNNVASDRNTVTQLINMLQME